MDDLTIDINCVCGTTYHQAGEYDINVATDFVSAHRTCLSNLELMIQNMGTRPWTRP